MTPEEVLGPLRTRKRRVIDAKDPLVFDGYVDQGFGRAYLGSMTGNFEPSWLAHPCGNMSAISPIASTDGVE